MNSFFDSSQGNAHRPEPDQPALLEAGLTALKHHDYATAIAHLEMICRESNDRSAQLKAQMGLVRAYKGVGKLSWAIALCKPLCDSPSSRVRQWAIQTLEVLSVRAAQQDASSPPIQGTSPDRSSPPPMTPASPSALLHHPSDRTGFLPIPDLHSPTALEPTAADETGFMPLHPPAQSAQDITQMPASDQTGFVPFNAPTASPSEAAANTITAMPSGFTAEEFDNPFTLSDDSVVEELPPTLTPLSGDTILQVEPEQQNAAGIPDPVTQVVEPEEPEEPEETTAPPVTWKQAGRAQRWGTLGSVDRATLWGVSALSVVALLGMVRAIAAFSLGMLNWVLSLSIGPLTLQGWMIQQPPVVPLLVLLIVSMAVFPWLWDAILQGVYGAKPLDVNTLTGHSSETIRLLKRVSNQKRYPLPSLSLIPTPMPLIFSYGHYPGNVRIAVSQGVLDQLRDDEIATLYAGELGHVLHWDLGVLSWMTLIVQLPYLVYWSVASWGDRQRSSVLRGMAMTLSSLAYGLYWLLRWPGLWLARVRMTYSDRTACELTGNPNGLTRALLKITLSTAQTIQQQGHIDPLLESIDLLNPVSYRAALTLGSLYPHPAPERLLAWDLSNPYRSWLTLNHSHPPLGDRLRRLTGYARFWRLEPELSLPTANLTSKATSPDAYLLNPRLFGLQAAPFLGGLIGLTLAGLLWLVGAVAEQLQMLSLSWMWGDRSLVWGFFLIGISFGIFLRINDFFPDITRSTVRNESILIDLLTAPHSLPINSVPIRLKGRLLGRRGLGGVLNQDLMLDSAQGLLKLHHFPLLGPMSNLFLGRNHPRHLINRPVTITGWFRRGATPWIDIEMIQPQQGAYAQAGHPLWSTLLALTAALVGVLTILQGNSLG